MNLNDCKLRVSSDDSFNPRPCVAFYSVERRGGGVRRTPLPNSSAPDGVRASRKTSVLRSKRGSRWYANLRYQVNQSPQRSGQTLVAGHLTRLSSGPYKVDRNEQIGAKLRLNTSKHPEIDIRRKFGHSRSDRKSTRLNSSHLA